MQVFRLMNMPDRVIAFDELPERLLSRFDMCNADGFPRHWKEWLGKKKRITQIPPEKDFLTGQVRRFEPIVEENHFFYVVDYTVNPMVEKWKELCDYVRQHVSKETRLMENIDDMAVPLAANKSDGVTLEPEDVPVIPIPPEAESLIVPVVIAAKKEELPSLKCTEDGCTSVFEKASQLRMHKLGKHRSKVAV